MREAGDRPGLDRGPPRRSPGRGIVFGHHGSYVGVEFPDHRLAWVEEKAVRVVEKRDEGEGVRG